MHLCHRVLDHLLVGHITLVADKQLVDTLGGIAINLLQPLLDVVERVCSCQNLSCQRCSRPTHVCHVKDDADTVGAPVVGRRDGPEALLARRVPLSTLA